MDLFRIRLIELFLSRIIQEVDKELSDINEYVQSQIDLERGEKKSENESHGAGEKGRGLWGRRGEGCQIRNGYAFPRTYGFHTGLASNGIVKMFGSRSGSLDSARSFSSGKRLHPRPWWEVQYGREA
jgi:hypothetical protein